ncbi:polyisoprenoid-binding protein [Brachybacterium vulturis]|uniref:Polyisoprenoid-binding protein n=1 Tax=Brachybacterium vulturis TaxID=2017484 RepID=A0A291GMN8_9MICO|nr:YceI family protein [Brachybacterium vulturis]ATG51234.1 polyisoprenoid-binding protein [Brachybacterium vulturis]
MNDLTPGTWTLDPAHTSAAFTVRHAGISKARGQFQDISGVLEVGEAGKNLSFTTTLRTESINTAQPDRDDHLRSSDFFDAENFPEIRFVSTAVEGDALTGDLTIRDITRSVELDFTYEGAATDPFGVYRAGFTGETSISRKEFGLTWNAALEAGGVMVGDDVKILIEAEFTAPVSA